MQTLVLGASGATGKHLVNQLLAENQEVKIIVRATSKIPDAWSTNENLSIIKANITEMNAAEMKTHLQDCQAVASCLGHNMTWEGIYGIPRLVTNAIKLVGESINQLAPEKPIKIILMNTAGNKNRDLKEPSSFGERIIIALLRLLLPPHPDNEQAAEFLRAQIGQNHPYIEWVVVRPDSLTNDEQVSEYTAHPSPTRNAIFNPGTTSRINVGHFMAQLITDDKLWTKWKGQMPVIYNVEKEIVE